ncbi:MAG TPA: hypothetical protein VJK03_03610 [Candidatus Nanoarchaeia archaeon]|nr:hypothetical protein [Candidatus Nanoarchaeia archaeon]
MSKTDDIANKMFTEKYWRQRRVDSLREACNILEEDFDIITSLSDKMFLLKYLYEFLEEHRKLPWVERQTIDPTIEAVGKYLMIHYDFRDFSKIHTMMYNRRDVSVNKQLREQRLFWNPAEI